MALSLANLAVSNRSLATFPPVITSPRFFNTKPTFRPVITSPRSFNNKLTVSPPFIRDLIKNAHRPHLSVMENLTRQLDLMDDQIGVKYKHRGRHRWSGGDNLETLFLSRNMDAALFLYRNMDALYERDTEESVPTRDWESLLHLTHFQPPCPNWDVIKDAKQLNQFVESTIGMHVISFTRVFCTLRHIYIVVGHEGPDPWDPCGGYVTKIYLPRKFYKIKDVYFEMSHGTVMIKIPMKNHKPIHKIKKDFLLFCEKKRQ